jgi:filamentous hemagglutinin family protein
MLYHNGLRKMRIELMISSAALSGLMLVSQAASAQSLPQTPTIVQGTPTITNPNANTTQVTVGAGATIINWNSFNIATNRTVNFSSANPNVASVLNRVTGTSQSTINGTLSSTPNVDVWLINTNGILFGGGSAVNTGGFVASTLDITDADFADGRASDRFFPGVGSTPESINTAGGPVSIRTRGGRLALIAPAINVQANFATNSGGAALNDAAFVVANDVTMAAVPGSPLAFTIAQGTPLEGNAVVNGSVNGRNVYYIMATQMGVTNALLNVGATTTATTAAATDRGIVLFADSVAAPSSSGVTTSAPLGTAGAKIEGEQTVLGQGGGYSAHVQGDLEITQRIFAANAPGFINLFSAGGIKSSSLLSAKNDIIVEGQSIDLVTATAGKELNLKAVNGLLKLKVGTAGTNARLTSSMGDVNADDVKSTLGDIFITADNALTAGNLSSGNRLVVLSNLGAVKIDNASSKTDMRLTALAGELTVAGNLNSTGEMIVRAENDVSVFGDARSGGNIIWSSVAGSINVNNTLTAAGSVALTTFNGNISAKNIFASNGSVNLMGFDIKAETVSGKTGFAASIVPGGISPGAIAVTNGLSEGIIDLSAGSGDVSVSGQLFSSGDMVTVSGQNINLASVGTGSLAGAITVSGNKISVGNVNSGSTINFTAIDGPIAGSEGTVRADNIFAKDAVDITANGSVAVNGGLVSENSAVKVTGGAVFVGLANAKTDLNLESLVGNLTLGSGSASGFAKLTSAADLSINGSLNADSGTMLQALNGNIVTGDVSSLFGAVAAEGKSVNSGTIFAGTTLDVTSSNGPLSVANAFADGTITLNADTDLSVFGQMKSAGGNAIATGKSIYIGAIEASSPAGLVSVTGSDIRITDVNAGASVTLNATLGSLSVGNAEYGSTLDLDAATNIALGKAVSKAGAVSTSADLLAGGDVTIGTLGAINDLAVNATGNVTAAILASQMGNVLVNGSTVNAGNIQSGGTIDVTTTNGLLSIGDAVASQNVRITSAGGLTVLGQLNSTNGGIAATGGAVTGGAVNIGAASAASPLGTVTIIGNGVVMGNAVSGDALSVDALSGPLTLDNAVAGTTATLKTSGALTVNGGVKSTSDFVSITGGSVDVQSVDAGTTFSIQSTNGPLILGRGTAVGNSTLVSVGALDVAGTIVSSAGSLQATGTSVNIGNAVANMTLDLRATTGSLNVGIAQADGDVMLMSETGLDVTGVVKSVAGSVTATGGTVNIKQAGAAVNLTAESKVGDLTLGTGNADGLVMVTAKEALKVTGSVNSLSGSVKAIGANIDIADAYAKSSFEANATTGALKIGKGQAADIALTAATAIDVTGSLMSDIGTIKATGETVNIASANARTDLTVNATTGDVTLGNANAVGDITLTAVNAVNAGSLRSTAGLINVNGKSVSVSSAEATAGNLTVKASDGALTMTNAIAGANIDLRATGNLTVSGQINSTNGAVEVNKAAGAGGTEIAGAVNIGAASAASPLGTVTIIGNGVVMGNAVSGDALSVDALSGPLTLDNAAAGTTATLKTSGALTVNGIVRSDIDFVSIKGGSVDVKSVDAGATLNIESTSGPLSLGSGTALGNLALVSAGAINVVGAIESTGGTLAATGASVNISDASAFTDLNIKATTGSATIGNARSTGGVTVTAATNLGVSGILSSLNGSISATGGTVNIASANAENNLLLTSTTGPLTLGSGLAGDNATISSAGALDITGALTGASVNVTANGAINPGNITATNGGLSLTGTSINGGALSAIGDLNLKSTSGAIQLASATSGATTSITSATTLDVTGAVTGQNVRLEALGAIKTGDINATTGLLRVKGGSVNVKDATAATTMVMEATGGALDAANVKSGGEMILKSTGGSVKLASAVSADSTVFIDSASMLDVTGNVTGQNVSLLATGDIKVANIKGNTGFVRIKGGTITATDVSAGTSLVAESTTGGITLASAKADDFLNLLSKSALAVSGSVNSTNNAVSAFGSTVNIGSVSAKNLVDVKSLSGNLLIGPVSSGTTATLNSAANLDITGPLNAGGAIAVAATGALKTAAVTATTGAISLAGQSVDVASASGASDITIAVRNGATLGAITGGSNSTVGITSNQIAMNGAITAGSVTLTKADGATGITQLGNFNSNAANAFALSQTELALINSNNLTVNAGNSTLDIGDLQFTANAGKNNVSLLTLGQLFVRGTVVGSGLGRTFVLGGSATGKDLARVITINATPIAPTDNPAQPTSPPSSAQPDTNGTALNANSTGGGRLLFDNSNLELRGARIVAGLEAFRNITGFSANGTGIPLALVESQFIHNEVSQLYSAEAGSSGGYLGNTVPLLSANNLVLRYSDYALFQNTGGAGVSSGINLGGSAQPNLGSLTLDASLSNGQNAFSLFGTLAGVSGELTALQGAPTLILNGINPSSSRINGCLVGSTTGCLTATVVQILTGVIKNQELTVVDIETDENLLFNPIVGTNNESLFSAELIGSTNLGNETACESGSANCSVERKDN